MNQMIDSHDPQSIMQKLRSKYFKTQRHRQIQRELDRLLSVDERDPQIAVPVRFTDNLETKGFLIAAKSGDGKTTAIARVLRQHPALGEANDASSPKYVRIIVPSPATLKSLGKAILAALGVTGVSDRTSAMDIWSAIGHRLKLLGIVVLWIDEAQDVFLSKSAREIDDMLKTLKSLMQGDGAVIVILSGTDRLLDVARYDQQVDRRFRKVVTAPLAIGHDEPKILQLVETYCELARLKPQIDQNAIMRLIHGSRFRFGRAIEIILAAIESALYDESSTLSIQHFAEAWTIQEACSWDQNVFVCKDWASLDLDAEADEFEGERTSRQRRQVGRG
ncbi:TniB family NTP-binding protein [Roseovarius sp. EL26]|uniref:TniB family NTP-binding protein n=1 Tax=Roseovarius sp. EL26 TaxID=2126672 RepID=UPI000EA0317D|nr:TniB family NTP-binding protein [Roseovarius sp. EL26]